MQLQGLNRYHVNCRYIPENFYSDLCVDQTSSSLPISHQVVSMPDYLQTVVAGTGHRSSSALTTTTPANHVTTSQGIQLHVSVSLVVEGGNLTGNADRGRILSSKPNVSLTKSSTNFSITKDLPNILLREL